MSEEESMDPSLILWDLSSQAEGYANKNALVWYVDYLTWDHESPGSLKYITYWPDIVHATEA